MELSAVLWDQLPVEILDQVLSFLPVPDMCRYRTVCKRWNQLICDPEFGSLCAGNASKRNAPFIAMRYTRSPKSREPSGWCFLDLNARRWYVVKDDARELRHCLFQGIVGMDGGLVCQSLNPNYSHTIEGYRVVVYNPIAKTQKELPDVPKHLTSEFYPLLNMVVDTISQGFKIFVVYYGFDTEDLDDPNATLEKRLSILNYPLMRVYDSATDEWKGLSNPSCIRSGVGHASSVMFQGFLYVFLPSFSLGEEQPLWRYNLVEDVWENLPVHIPEELHGPELIASANRLFLEAWYDPWHDDRWLFKVCEIKIPELTQEILFEIPRADIVGGFDLKIGIENPVSDMPRISVIGFDNSLLFMSKSTGISAVFDLVTRSWDHGFPPNPLEYLPDEQCLFVGKQMNLVLPSTLW